MSRFWKRGKRKNEEESFASEGDGNRSSKAPKKDDEDADTIVVADLSKNRKVSVRTWQGKIAVDIREFYMKDGKEFPGKKGIQLSLDQWEILRDHVDEIDKEVAGDA